MPLNQPKGTRFINNEIDLISPEYDGKAQASNHIYINGTDQSVDVPLDVVLGSDISQPTILNAGTGSPTLVDNGDGTWTLDLVGYSGNIYLPSISIVPTQTNVELDLDITVSQLTSTVNIQRYNLNDGNGNIFVDAPSLTIKQKVTPISDGNIVVDFNGASGTYGTYLITPIVKEIASVTTKTLLLYNPVDKEYQAIADGSVGKEVVVNGDFSDGLNGWNVEVGTGISVVNNKLVFDNTSNNSRIFQGTLITGKTYTITLDVTTYTGGTLRIYNATKGTIYGTVTSSGLTTITFTALDSVFYLYSVLAEMEVDIVSVKEVLPNSATYTIISPFSQVCKFDFVLTQTQIDYLNANVDSLMDIHTGRNLHPALGITKADMKGYWAGNDYPSGAYVQDLTVDAVETFTDPDFNTGIDWTLNGSVSIAGGKLVANATANNTGCTFINPLIVGEIYISEYKINSISVGSVRVRYPDTDFIRYTTPQTVTRVFKCTDDVFPPFLQFETDGCTAEIEYWSMRKATALEILNYTQSCRDTYRNVNYGATDVLFEKDNSGRLTGNFAPNGTIIPNDGYINTQWSPTSKYSIEWNGVVGGVTEQRFLSFDGTNYLYYIDGVLQGSNPTVPSGTLLLNNVAPIGNPDTVDEILQPFNIWSDVQVP